MGVTLCTQNPGLHTHIFLGSSQTLCLFKGRIKVTFMTFTSQLVLTSKMIYEVLGMVPGSTQVPPHVLGRFRPKGPEPGSVSPLPAEAGDLGLVVVVMVWGWMR